MYKIKESVLILSVLIFSLPALADFKVHVGMETVKNSVAFRDLTTPPAQDPICIRDLSGNFVYITSGLYADFYIDGVSNVITISYNLDATYEYNGFVYSIGETQPTYTHYKPLCKIPA